MELILKINDDISIAGQITLEQLPALAQEGFRSILNLQACHEAGFVTQEQDKAEFLGLHYLHYPCSLGNITERRVRDILQILTHSSKPILVHCDSGVRSAAMALMYVATNQGVPLEQSLRQVQRLGLSEEPLSVSLS